MAKVYHATKHSPFALFRTISATQSPLGDTEKTASQLSNEVLYKIPEMMNNMEVRLSCSSASGSGTAYFYAARNDDDIVLLGSAAITAGNQVATTGKFYVDTIVLTDLWITEVKVVAGNGNNNMGRIVFDTSGYDNFFIRINYNDGAETWTWDVGISGFN